MNFLIQIKDDMPIDHPIAEKNLRAIIPDLDLVDPPSGFARFVRKPLPELTGYQRLESVEYVIDPELTRQYNTPVYTDQYNIKTLTEEDLVEMADAETKTMNENMRKNLNAPYPAPDDGLLYIWSASSNQWIVKPDNFDAVVAKFTKKIDDLGLSNLTPEELENIDADKKAQLQLIIDEINTYQNALK